MEWLAAVALLTTAGVVTLIILRKPKTDHPRPATFTCSRCGEKHCHCEQQP